MNAGDTIAAIATPAGAGGVGVVRLSGPHSVVIARELTGTDFKPRVLRLCTFKAADGSVLDRGLAVHFPTPASFTGEDVVELHAHGSPIVLDLLLKRLCALGARPARPGEFSERAFLNGKLDLAQAEAVADLIASGSEAAARAAMRSLEGEFSQRVGDLFDALVRLRVWLESALDFPEEEIDFLAAPQLREGLDHLHTQVDALLNAARSGVRLRDGLHVVIIGRPNAGKSSLLNTLARSERAIVTAIPGTTRDVLRESVQLDGIGLTLVDTAGLRDSDDEVEREGIRRACAELQAADVVILVTDSANLLQDAALLSAADDAAVRVFVHNKIDLDDEPARIERDDNGDCHVHLSAKTGDGVELLSRQLVALSGGGEDRQGTFSARQRHVDALDRVAIHLQQAEAQLSDGVGELAAEELRQAQKALGEITGRFSSDDLLGAIFSTFCVGK